jgi:glucose 1-dehydrogenase
MSTKKLALVTGGAQGIGYACAEALKEDGFGVILSDINADGVAEAAERLGAVAGIACDMGDAAAVLAMFDRIEAEHGVVSALVNNAGVAMPGDFLDYDLAAFDTVIGINLRGTFSSRHSVRPRRWWPMASRAPSSTCPRSTRRSRSRRSRPIAPRKAA